MQVLRVAEPLLEDNPMNKISPTPDVVREPFVDAREAAYTMNLPMYYMTNARQRRKLRLPHYHIGRMVRFKLSELAQWLQAQGGSHDGL